MDCRYYCVGYVGNIFIIIDTKTACVTFRNKKHLSEKEIADILFLDNLSGFSKLRLYHSDVLNRILLPSEYNKLGKTGVYVSSGRDFEIALDRRYTRSLYGLYREMFEDGYKFSSGLMQMQLACDISYIYDRPLIYIINKGYLLEDTNWYLLENLSDSIDEKVWYRDRFIHAYKIISNSADIFPLYSKVYASSTLDYMLATIKEYDNFYKVKNKWNK